MLADLLACGVRTVINVQEEDERGAGGVPFPNYLPQLNAIATKLKTDVEYYRFAIADCDIPARELMETIQRVMKEAVDAGKVVHVHCWGGHGRTGTVAGCWLVERGATAEDALRTIKQRRVHDVHLSKEPAPQTASQLEFVRSWRPTLAEHRQSIPTPNARSDDAALRPRHPGREALADRAVGAFVGLAVGDAVGAAVEFMEPGSFPPLTDMIGGGPFKLKPGEWTDDTSMALCLAESLTERRGFDPVDQLKRYVRWWKQGHFSVKGYCFDIGNQVRAALSEHLSTGKPCCGPVGPRHAGNGSLMRLSPVAIAYAHSPSDAISYASESSRTTHGNQECVDACRYFAGLLVGLIRGEAKQQVLCPAYCPVPGLWENELLSPKVAAIAAGSFKQKPPPSIKGGGYVVDCLEAALWAFHSTDSFEQAVLRAANLGDDADTTAAVCGQIAGAFYGASGIPERWLAKLARRDAIESLAEALIVAAPKLS